MPNIHRAEGIYIRKDQRSAVRKRSAEFPHTQILRLVWSYGKFTPTKMRYFSEVWKQNWIHFAPTSLARRAGEKGYRYTCKLQCVECWQKSDSHTFKAPMWCGSKGFLGITRKGSALVAASARLLWSNIEPTFLLSDNVRVQKQNDSDVRGTRLDSQNATLWKQTECSSTWDRWLA